ncbi:2TM domain-containing protein [Chryseobacterium oranimense]|uniref:2TM domain-containing protein n=1 Tax=Chryseobacterium oranimense TaxID=421058 RepID=A0A1M5Q2W7_9FLAO|nr:2TM domain-containing protein [Chryseobacterium oranimense]SHH08111.1 2TM domain-containing protein [Chryseobacterium oranimense]
MKDYDENDIRYQHAKRQVERLSRFYRHLFIYIVVNILIVFYNCKHLDPGESYFQFKNFFTATFWGIGLVAHAISVFLPNVGFVRNWEEERIRKEMKKNKE